MLFFSLIKVEMPAVVGVFFMLYFFPRDALDEIWDLIESVSEGFSTYS